MDEDENVIKAREPAKRFLLLQQKFDEETVKQSERLDDIAKLLVGVQTVIPGIYVAVLKLLGSNAVTNEFEISTIATMALWTLALILTFSIIFPRFNHVNRESPMQIEAFYNDSARRKLGLLIFSCFTFFCGIFTAMLSV